MSDGAGSVALIALVAIVPVVVLMLTSFVKVSVVLALLRNAIGAPDAPSGLVVMGVSLVLTFFVMAPVAVDMIGAAASTSTLDPGPAPLRPGPTAPAGAITPGPRAPSGTTTPASPAPPAPARTTTSVAAGTATSVPAGTATSAPERTATPAPTGRTPPAPTGTAPSSPAGTTTPAPGGSTTPAPTDGALAPAPLVPLELEAAVRQIVPAEYGPKVDAVARALVPLKAFLARHADARDRETFVGVAQNMGRAATGDELWVLAPAFLTTELREAFAIAVLIFIPFLVIDLVVGLGLAALGLQTTQPQVVALPLKLLLFVAVDGWRLLIDSLLRGYA